MKMHNRVLYNNAYLQHAIDQKYNLVLWVSHKADEQALVVIVPKEENV